MMDAQTSVKTSDPTLPKVETNRDTEHRDLYMPIFEWKVKFLKYGKS